MKGFITNSRENNYDLVKYAENFDFEYGSDFKEKNFYDFFSLKINDQIEIKKFGLQVKMQILKILLLNIALQTLITKNVKWI